MGHRSESIAELEAENSQLRATVEESTGTIATLQRYVDAVIEDYDMLMEGNKSLLTERDKFHYHCKDLKVEVARVRSDVEKNVADLEARVKSTEAHIVDVAATGEK
jgi:chromosome segregation ATPase